MNRLEKLMAATAITFMFMASFARPWVAMGKAQTGSFSQQGSVAYDYKVTLTSTDTTKTGEWILIPGGVQSISVTLPRLPRYSQTNQATASDRRVAVTTSEG